MELVQGMKNKRELAALKKVIKSLDIETLQIDPEISAQAMSYVEKFFHSDSFAMADALIAATCAKYNEPLCTANNKHYKVVSGLKMDVFRP